MLTDKKLAYGQHNGNGVWQKSWLWSNPVGGMAESAESIRRDMLGIWPKRFQVFCG